MQTALLIFVHMLPSRSLMFSSEAKTTGSHWLDMNDIKLKMSRSSRI
jgi:hypothetical protein